jgi:hypothetical protein
VNSTSRTDTSHGDSHSGMSYTWGGQPDEGESPASSGSGATNDGEGRGFWLGGGASDRSEDELDGGYGLFSPGYAGYSNAGPGEALSMDFWNTEDIKPAHLGGQLAGTSDSTGNTNTFTGGQGTSYEDPLLKARKEMLLGSSPNAMETFDDLAGFGSG